MRAIFMRFKFIIVSVLVLIAAYSAFWFKVANEVKKSTLEWIEAQKNSADDLKVFVGDIDVTGFPYKIAVSASSLNVIISAGDYSALPIFATFPNVSVVYQPWKPCHGVIVTDYFDVVIGDIENPQTSVAFEGVKSSVILDTDTMALNSLSIMAENVSWHAGAPSENGEISFMDHPEFHLRKYLSGINGQNSYDLPVNKAIYFKANNAVINEFKSNLLGKNADQIIIETILHANQMPQYSVASLSKWRDEGGTLTIRTFEYGNKESRVKLSGDVTLDENLKPLGAFDVQISNIHQFLENLSQSQGLLKTAQSFINSQSSNQAQTKELPLSLSLQNGFLYVGPIQVIALSPVIGN